jgi:hypothetical protein
MICMSAFRNLSAEAPRRDYANAGGWAMKEMLEFTLYRRWPWWVLPREPRVLIDPGLISSVTDVVGEENVVVIRLTTGEKIYVYDWGRLRDAKSDSTVAQ